MAASGTTSLTESGSPCKIVRGTQVYKCADYNVAWICALSATELLAARVLLDEEHIAPSYNTEYDRNTYICGKVGEHRVVVACMPSGRSGNVNAGHLTGPMFHTFPNIKITLLVGIGGGVPLQTPQDPLEDVYLGDVVIGWPGDGTPAVIQYDLGRWKSDGFEQRGSVDQPDWHLTQALDIIFSNHEVGQTDFRKGVARLQQLPKFASRRSDEDRLFQATYKHEGDYYSRCSHCLPKNLVQRPERAEARPDGLFKFHRGTIASGGAVIQDGKQRDKLSSECNNARCFEMEAVGVNINSRCLVIRGLADYADSHKNDAWKYVAAGNAAVFAKEFLLTIKAGRLKELSGIVGVRKTPISTLPKTLSIDPDFVGRDDIMRRMDQQFTKNNSVALVGLGGIGKTEIAVQYSHEYRKRTQDCHILWVYGSTQQSFDEAYIKIAEELEIPGHDDPLFNHRRIVPRVLDRPETRPWIMIVDNADDYNIYFPPPNGALGETEQSKYLKYCLPHGAENGGRLIITTRNSRVGKDIMSNFAPIQVSKLAPVDAQKLLRSKVPPDKWEDETATMLLRELDYIPLAITQAGAFVKHYKMTSLEFYLSKCQSHLQVQNVLSKELHDARRQPGIPSAIFRTWRISYEQIKLDNNEAANKLSLMAVFDTQAIPQMLLAKGDILDMADMDAIQLLLDFSLIKGDQQYQYFSMHPLQQLSTQDWLRFDSSRLDEWRDHGLVLISNRIPKSFPRTREEGHMYSVLLPHATVVVSYESQKLDYRSELLRKMCYYELNMGRYQDAHQHAVQSYEDSLEAHGEASKWTIICKLFISFTLVALETTSIYPEKQMAKLAQEIENVFHCNGSSEAEVAYKSARKLWKNGSHDAAFAALQRARNLYQACSNHRRALYCLDDLAYFKNVKGKLEESESLYRKAMQESINLYGDYDPSKFDNMKNIGELVEQQGRIAEAAKLYRLVLQGMKEIYGMEHPKTMEVNINLASIARDEGNLVYAEMLGRRVLEYSQRKLGWDHMLTWNAVSDLQETLQDLGRLEEAIELTDMMLLDFDVVSAAIASSRIGNTLVQNFLSDLEQMMRRSALETQEQIGHCHPDNILVWDRLALCLELQEKWEAAEKYRRRSLYLEHHTGDEYVEMTNGYLILANNLFEQDKHQAALQLIQDLLRNIKCHQPEDIAKIQEVEHVHEIMLSLIDKQRQRLTLQEQLKAPATDDRWIGKVRQTVVSLFTWILEQYNLSRLLVGKEITIATQNSRQGPQHININSEIIGIRKNIEHPASSETTTRHERIVFGASVRRVTI